MFFPHSNFVGCEETENLENIFFNFSFDLGNQARKIFLNEESFQSVR